MVNFDQNAGLSLNPLVREKVLSLLGEELNPSSIHKLGQRAKFLIEEARRGVKHSLGATDEDTVIFTSGATEANNQAVFGAYWKFCGLDQRAEVLSSLIEHPSVLEPLDRLEKVGWTIHRIKPNSAGEIESERIRPFLSEKTRLVSLMLANNETGVINPISEIAKIVRAEAPKALIHTDAVQAVAKLPINFAELGVDLLTISGHKFGAMKGVGALLVRAGVSIPALLLGGAQEKHLRAGTENVWGVVSLGEALKLVDHSLESRISTMRSGLEFLRKKIATELPWSNFHAAGSKTLPNTISLYLPGVDADDLVVGMDLKGVAISSGAACASGKPDPSHVLLGMGASAEIAKSTVRISIGPDLSQADLDRGAAALISLASEMRQ